MKRRYVSIRVRGRGLLTEILTALKMFGEGCVVVWEALEALKETDEALEVVVDAELLVKVEDGVEADEGAADEDGF
jgi:hypothetical protein